jgi:hypothetical protein
MAKLCRLDKIPSTSDEIVNKIKTVSFLLYKNRSLQDISALILFKK